MNQKPRYPFDGAADWLATRDPNDPVWGLPTSWADASYERKKLFHLLVRDGSNDRREEVWEVIISGPDLRDWLRPPACRLRRVEPQGDGTAWIRGCIDLAHATVALFCDHTVTPHRPRRVTFDDQQQGLVELWQAIVEEAVLDDMDVAAYIAERLRPLAIDLVAGIRSDPGAGPLVETPCTLLPAGDEWAATG